jgi:hypothetical protein
VHTSVTERPHDQKRTKYILEVVTYIFWINAIVLKTLRDGYFGFPQIISRLDGDFEKIITKEEGDFDDRAKDLYEARIKDLIVRHVKKLPQDEITAIIRDSQQCKFYREALRIKVTKSAASSRAATIAERKPDLDIPEYYNWCKSIQDYVGQLSVEVEQHRDELAVFLKLFSELLRSIQATAGSSYFSEEELQALKVKLQAVNDYYPVVNSAAHGASASEQYLINPTSERWWLVSQVPK